MLAMNMRAARDNGAFFETRTCALIGDLGRNFRQVMLVLRASTSQNGSITATPAPALARAQATDD
jgi:hypothetical protein